MFHWGEDSKMCFPVSLILFAITGFAGAREPVQLVEVKKIWDQAPHNAFTDLIRFQDRWFCVFREGQGHVSPDGAFRVITSSDGEHWESAALITSPHSDLRDAKLSVTPDGQLMLVGAENLHTPSTHRFQSLVWFSLDGRSWSERHEIADADFWLWRITWHKGRAYGFGYGCGNDNRHIRLYASLDGKSFQTLIAKVSVEGTYPNETSLVFLPDDTAYCLLRQDGEPKNGYLGTSRPPYTDWSWKQLNTQIGGPHMIALPDGRLVAVVRLYDERVRTSLCRIDAEAGTLTELLALPSGGDTSYAGLVLHEGLLWVSYYSSHEGKANIYLAKVRIAPSGP